MSDKLESRPATLQGQGGRTGRESALGTSENHAQGQHTHFTFRHTQTLRVRARGSKDPADCLEMRV